MAHHVAIPQLHLSAIAENQDVYLNIALQSSRPEEHLAQSKHSARPAPATTVRTGKLRRNRCGFKFRSTAARRAAPETRADRPRCLRSARSRGLRASAICRLRAALRFARGERRLVLLR